MASGLDAQWQLFRRYEFKGITIEDTRERIHFSQRVSFWNQRANQALITTRIIGALIWGIPTLVIGSYAGFFAAFLYFFVAAIPMGLILFVAYFVFRDRMAIDIYPEHVVITEGSRRFDIPVDDITNIDVRSAQHVYGIYVWQQKIPIFTFTQNNEPDAISLKEGIVLAIRLMNEVEIVAKPAQARRFDE